MNTIVPREAASLQDVRGSGCGSRVVRRRGAGHAARPRAGMNAWQSQPVGPDFGTPDKRRAACLHRPLHSSLACFLPAIVGWPDVQRSKHARIIPRAPVIQHERRRNVYISLQVWHILELCPLYAS